MLAKRWRIFGTRLPGTGDVTPETRAAGCAPPAENREHNHIPRRQANAETETIASPNSGHSYRLNSLSRRYAPAPGGSEGAGLPKELETLAASCGAGLPSRRARPYKRMTRKASAASLFQRFYIEMI